MIFAIDENETTALGHSMSFVVPDHQFVHVLDIGLGGTKDIPLYEALSAKGITALITRDSNQLKDPAERQAIINSGLHWIGHKSPRGSGGQLIGRLMARYSTAMPYIVGAIDQLDAPAAFRVAGMADDFGSCLKVQDLGTQGPIKFDGSGQRK